MAKRDYYEVLGLQPGASMDEIKRAYRALALKHHPDRNLDGKDDAAVLFKEASEAYGVLSDPDKRGQYDRFGHAAFEGGSGGFDFSSAFGGASMFEDVLGDLFGDFFGGGGGRQRGRSRAARGEDLRYDMEISFVEAVCGTEKEITIPRTTTCATCSGSGATAGSGAEKCPGCHGAGQVSFRQGLFQISKTCGECNGQGSIITSPCGDCRGSGHVQERRNIKVKVPAGVDDGSRLKLRGEGEAGYNGGPTGDLYVMLGVHAHELFVRNGNNIVCDLPVSMTQASLGGKVDAPTLDGMVKITIPAGTQTGRLFRLRGKGAPDLRGRGKGDQIIHVRVETPSNLSKKQKELLREFDKAGQKNSESLVAGFADKVRELLG